MMTNLIIMFNPLSIAFYGSTKMEVICPKYMRKKGKVSPAIIEEIAPTVMYIF